MVKKAAKVKRRRAKSDRAAKQALNASKKRIKPANTYLTEGHPELPSRKPAPRQ